jgi:tRNA dimethylallyltransferase
MKSEKLIVIIGPTAVGKTELSLELAKKMSTEIISGDSMLVYKGFDVGTAKPTLLEQKSVEHHMIDILNPEQEFSVTQFKAYAQEHIQNINRKGKIPILAGGTGLYVKSLVEDYAFNETPGDEVYRRELETLAEKQGKEYVHDMLRAVDPKTAERLHVNDFRRVIRALEVYHMGGELISQDKAMLEDGKLAYDAVVIGLNRERSHLYERINQRVDLMIESGFVEEVRALLHAEVPRNCQAMKGIGYLDIIGYLDGLTSLDAAIENIKKATRHFAKRQLTWYRKMPYIHWYDVEAYSSKELLKIVFQDIAGEFSLK